MWHFGESHQGREREEGNSREGWREKLHIFQEEVGQVLYLNHCIVWLRDLGNKKNGVEAFGKFGNVVLEENGD